MGADSEIDKLAAEEAFRSFLVAFGMKDNKEVIDNTPRRVVEAYAELARVVETYSRRPQRQERLTVQITQWLEETLRPRGVGVIMTARHSCMSLRGARVDSATTVTSAFKGELADDSRHRAYFLSLLNIGAGAE
jgi:GTP cyclohydrolase IA